jgi:phospho-N-acetylmuramoyl-pentapeptide-transferase
MLYWLYENMGILNFLKYQSYRAFGAALTAFLLMFFIMPKVIKWAKSVAKLGQPIRDIGLAEQLKKKGTPTMGGLGIILSFTITLLLWADLKNIYVWICAVIFWVFGLIGAFDDYAKLKRGNYHGISARLRIILQTLVSFIAVFLIEYLARETIYLPYSTGLTIPFIKNFMLDLSYFYFVFGIMVIIGAGNAVNLTDGMDGLVSVPVITTCAVMGIFAFVSGSYVQSAYFNMFYLPHVSEILVLCCIAMAAVLAFLWYNSHPAQIFMGDTGALALGGLLGVMAVALRAEFVLAIAGIVFVGEALSVILQIASYKLTGKRIFKISPIHHHFEAIGIPETKIVARIWIIAIMAAVIALVSLKLR